MFIYPILCSSNGSDKLTLTMKEQVLKGRVFGCPRWSCKRVDSFFGTNYWYGIPCSAADKGDRLGRIFHDYSYFKPGSYSISAAHANTSVRYDSVRRRVLDLYGITWYIKANLKNGFRQIGTHSADWCFQVCSNCRN